MFWEIQKTLNMGKDLNLTVWGFPSLQSKAAASKVLTRWLCSRALKFAERPHAKEVDKTVAACIFAYDSMLRLMKECGHILSESEARQFFDMTMAHLKCYAWLHSYGQKAKLHDPGRKSWLLLPKLHHMWHLGHDTLRNRVNPGICTLLCAESFVGSIGRISRATHRSTVSVRTLERYLAKMHLTLEKLGY